MTNTPNFAIGKLTERDNHGYLNYSLIIPSQMQKQLGWSKGEYLSISLDKKTKSLKVSKLEVMR